MKSLLGIVILLVLVLAGIFLYTESESLHATWQTSTDGTVEVALPKPVSTTPATSSVLPYGSVTLKLNQPAKFEHISIVPVSLEEDSRCPSDVQCIQAGTVRVKILVVSAMGTSTNVVKLGTTVTTEAYSVTLINVTPGKMSTVPNEPGDYKFTFTVTPPQI